MDDRNTKFCTEIVRLQAERDRQISIIRDKAAQAKQRLWEALSPQAQKELLHPRKRKTANDVSDELTKYRIDYATIEALRDSNIEKAEQDFRDAINFPAYG